ncbi:MAG: response regulator [Candidatus Brocadiia bacterium]
MKILVVEDERPVRDSVCEMLAHEGYEMHSACNGKEGISKAEAVLPELIICDINMPEMNGFGFVEALRKSPSTSLIPVIFLTGFSDMETMRTGMELGADDFVPKPFTRQMLLKAIRARANRAASYAQVAESKVNDFVKRISMSIPHELRTPLASIIGYSEFLKKFSDTVSREELLEMVDLIYSSGNRLLETIEKFILFSRLETMMLAKEKPTEAASSTSIVYAKMMNKTTSLWERTEDIESSISDCRARVEEQHLFKVFEELLSNAVKFSEKGTHITVSAVKDGDYVIISTTNVGRGMTKEQIAQVRAMRQFQREYFEQQGIGLGLTIVQLIADVYGGTLEIASVPGDTTTVSVTLPCAS